MKAQRPIGDTPRGEPDWTARIRRLSGIGAWAMLALVCVGSLLPRAALPESLPSPVVLHFVAYLAPAALAALAAADVRKASNVGVVILLISVAVEAAQSLIPGRYSEIEDAVVNMVGVIAGIAAGRVAAALLRLAEPTPSR